MYLNQALTKIRNLKSKLSRTDKIIASTAVQYEDTNPEYIFLDEIDTRLKLIEEIRELKAQVQKTNVQTKVVYNNKEISLAELILMNSDLRSEMAFVTSLLELTTEEEGGWRSSTRTKDDIKKVFAEGYSKADLRSYLEKLEQQKEQMDGLFTNVNASTELVAD